MTATPEAHLRRRGLKPLSWNEVLHAVEAKLMPEDLEIFRRRHRSFTSYPMEHTCRAFYDFAARKGLLDLLASFRFERLCRIAACLSALPLRGKSILEVGAGGGYLSGYLQEELKANLSVTDWSAASLEHLQSRGLKIFTEERPSAHFDFLLCADSLGEVNSDEDSWLREPENIAGSGYVDELEQRYGFTAKLAQWKPAIASGGSVLLFEPIGFHAFWEGAVSSLRQSGWKAEILGPEPVWGLVARLDKLGDRDN